MEECLSKLEVLGITHADIIQFIQTKIPNGLLTLEDWAEFTGTPCPACNHRVALLSEQYLRESFHALEPLIWEHAKKKVISDQYNRMYFIENRWANRAIQREREEAERIREEKILEEDEGLLSRIFRR